jgi:hypothetical protein
MASRKSAKCIVRFSCAVAAVMLCLAVPAKEARTEGVEFKGIIATAESGSVQAWPSAIVSFTTQAILPIDDVCIADCKNMTVSRQGAAAHFRIIVVRGERAAVVETGDGAAHYLVCDGGRASCMRYTVLRGR